MIFVADVGGTKTDLALYGPGDIAPRARTRVASNEHAGLAEAARDFLNAARGSHAIDRAVLAVAGPTDGIESRITNLPWVINARALERDLGIRRIRLVNDFAAVAAGVPELSDADVHVLQPAPIDPHGLAIVIGAGTGLGEAFIVPTSAGARRIATEGGHVDFAARNETEVGLLRALQAKHGRVSVERAVSGPGLVSIYEYVIASALERASPETARTIATSPDAAGVIGEQGVLGSDPACARALSIFVELYGAEAGNFALKTLPAGGVFVAGGIAPKILPAMERSAAFMSSFLAKGRMRPLLEKLRVSVVTSPDVALRGARTIARDLEG